MATELVEVDQKYYIKQAFLAFLSISGIIFSIMGKYDITFKEIFFSGIDPPKNFFQHIIGIPLVKPLPTNLPSVKESVVDFLSEMADGSILHLEVQSTNGPDMHLRMHRYFCPYVDRILNHVLQSVVGKRKDFLV